MDDADPPARPLRADARRNRERVLQAAREAFAESGWETPLDVIAARAGVGPGTVYRHFPTKEALFQAVLSDRVAQLLHTARNAASDPDPGAAFFAVLRALAGEAAAKRDTPGLLSLPGDLPGQFHQALGTLLARAQAAGAVRPGTTGPDLVLLLKSLAGAARDSTGPEQVERLAEIVIDGLRHRGP